MELFREKGRVKKRGIFHSFQLSGKFIFTGMTNTGLDGGEPQPKPTKHILTNLNGLNAIGSENSEAIS